MSAASDLVLFILSAFALKDICYVMRFPGLARLAGYELSIRPDVTRREDRDRQTERIGDGTRNVRALLLPSSDTSRRRRAFGSDLPEDSRDRRELRRTLRLRVLFCCSWARRLPYSEVAAGAPDGGVEQKGSGSEANLPKRSPRRLLLLDCDSPGAPDFPLRRRFALAVTAKEILVSSSRVKSDA